MTGRGVQPRQIKPISTHPRMPCLKERWTDSRTYAALPITPVIIGRETFLPAETVSPPSKRTLSSEETKVFVVRSPSAFACG
jgi:hypothetical protein